MPQGKITRSEVITDEALKVFEQFKSDVDSVADSMKKLVSEGNKLKAQTEKTIIIVMAGVPCEV